jgi:uncharacterized protein YabE (DUF348 family)
LAVPATRVRRLRVRKAAARTTLAGLVLASGLLYVALQKNITLVVDGQAHPVATFDSSVGELLQVHGIALQPGDQVMPSPTTSLADGMVVVVHREVLPAASSAATASPTGGVWAVGGVSGALREELLAPAETALSADAPAGPSRIVNARVVVMGKVRDVLTNATTVRELLSAMGIQPDGSDRVLPSPSTPLSQDGLVRYVDVDTRTRKVTAPIPYGTYTTYSDSVLPGHVDIVRRGEPGRFLRTFRVRTVDGEVMARHRTGQRVLKEATAEHRVVGLSDSAPAPSESDVGSSGTPGSGSTSGGTEIGDASWYSFAPGSGFTAAHPWLPFGTRVTVTNLSNGKSVTVVINDRGPFGGRSIDLSPEAFVQIAPLSQGVAHVRLTW